MDKQTNLVIADDLAEYFWTHRKREEEKRKRERQEEVKMI